MANRGERRARTGRVVERRRIQYQTFTSRSSFTEAEILNQSPQPPKPGRAKKLSHLDCGRTQCQVCTHETRRPEPRGGWRFYEEAAG
jgi:hypothetical protein